MKFKQFIIFLLLSFYPVFSQDGFQFEKNKAKTSIPFQFINNLIIIPIQVNGVSLNFLLDTGVADTILFSLDETDEIVFSQVQKIQIKGLGNNVAIDAFKSANNKLSIKNYTDINHTLYLVLDQEINISAQVGIPVNGIIGYAFFKNDLVKIDYVSKRLTVYHNKQQEVRKMDKSFQKFPLELNLGKPYMIVDSFFENDKEPVSSKLLLDSGNGDSVWFFKNKNKNIIIPKSNYDDYLGRGFGGDIFGKRGRINSVVIKDYKFKNPLASFPDSTATTVLDKTDERLGSIGSEIMRRFTIIFDYQSNVVYLKKNNQFDEPFRFNMSGLDIQHQGLQWIKAGYENNPTISNNLFDSEGNKIANNLKYKFELKPIYIVANVRKDSPADVAGFQKNDVILKINNKEVYNFTLQKINDLLKSDDGTIIEFQIDRKGKTIKLKIQPKDIL